MRNVLVWYLPQAAIFSFGAYWAAQAQPPITTFAILIVGLMWAAAYTAAANIVMNLSARIRRRRSRAGSQ